VREGAISRSRKGFGTNEGTLVQSAVSPFARRHPGRTSAGPMNREALQASRRTESATRVPGAQPSRARATSSRARASPCSSVPARDLRRPRKWNELRASRLVQVAARKAPGAATLRRGRRNRHRLVPASSGAKVPLACEDRRLDGCARASNRLQKSANGVEAQRSAIPGGNGARGRGPSPGRCPQGNLTEAKTSRTSAAVAKPRGMGKARSGRSRGRCRVTVFARWKAPTVVWLLAPFTRAGRKAASAAPAGHVTRERHGQGGGGDRVSEVDPHAPRREDNARVGATKVHGCGSPKRNGTDVESGIPSEAPGAQAFGRRREPAERGCWYERMRRQKSVRRIVRHDVR